MNANLLLGFNRWWMLFVVCIFSVPLFAAIAGAADVTTPILQANVVYEFASDRAHMIQISVVFVAIGCAVMWWYR